MATSIPLPFKAHIPATPPPEFQMLMKGPPLQIPKPFTQGIHQTTASNSTPRQEPRSQPSIPPNLTDHIPLKPPHTNDKTTPATTGTAGPTGPTGGGGVAAAAAAAAAGPTGIDPLHVAMASRIASYYQQRCQAVTHFQQQRCQAWASTQRQKCQEMMQAATVIVAWYIRDRITRRRKRRRRSFKRGLAARDGGGSAAVPAAGFYGAGGYKGGVGGGGGGGRVSKGEAVRRWVLKVPSAAAAGVGSSPSMASRELPADKDEVDFDMDREVPADKDTQLFKVADNLIKSHLARVDVPLLGVLSFDESESESESEEEGEFMDYEEEEEEEEDYEYEEGEDVDSEGEDGNVQASRGGKEELAPGSKDAQPGTTAKGSLKRPRSSVS